MRISMNITNFSWPGDPTDMSTRLAGIVRSADEAGIDTVWVADHLIQADPNSSPDAEMLEAYTTLGFLAAHTTRVRLGTMVSAATYRAPTLLIKAVTTLDVLSGGRAWLGLGSGYQQDEATAMDLLLPPVAERFERLEEVLRLAHQMWSGDTAPFDGRHYRPQHPINNPQSLTRPRPPILIGGMGEQKTLRLVAQYADACNLFDVPDGGTTLRHKLDVLADHCEDLGRPFAEIAKTVSTRWQPGESADTFTARCTTLASFGIDHVVVVAPGPWTEEEVATLGAAVPGLGRLVPSPRS